VAIEVLYMMLLQAMWIFKQCWD